MRLSSVVFPAPRKPVKIVIGTALSVSATISIDGISELFCYFTNLVRSIFIALAISRRSTSCGFGSLVSGSR